MKCISILSVAFGEFSSSSPLPYAIWLRIKLNKAGFKFLDDGKISAVLNKKTEPIGEFYAWYDEESQVTHFKQELSKEQCCL